MRVRRRKGKYKYLAGNVHLGSHVFSQNDYGKILCCSSVIFLVIFPPSVCCVCPGTKSWPLAHTNLVTYVNSFSTGW